MYDYEAQSVLLCVCICTHVLRQLIF